MNDPGMYPDAEALGCSETFSLVCNQTDPWPSTGFGERDGDKYEREKGFMIITWAIAIVIH